RADGAGALAGVVDAGGVEGEELVVAAAVERELFDLARVDDAGGLFSGEIDAERLRADVDGVVAGDCECDVEIDRLADGEREIDELVVGKAGRFCGESVTASGDRDRGEAAVVA